MRLGRAVRRYPWVSASVVGGAASGYGVDQWLDVSSTAQLVVSVLAGLALLCAKFAWGIGYGAIYVIEVYHPKTGQPTCGYVGKTRQYPPSKRIAQHLEGSDRYGPSQPWSDTATGRWWLAAESRAVTNLGLHFRELFHIRVRRPLYNYTMNLGNSRRIPKPKAERQRDARDRRRAAVNGDVRA